MHRKRIFILLAQFFILAADAKPSNWSFDKNVEVFFDVSGQEVREKQANNVNNRILDLPKYTGLFELRPDFKLSSDRSKIVLRPQYTVRSMQIEHYFPDETISRTIGKAQLNDFFIENLWTDSFTTVAGLQVYQWGPAELINPSNPLFTFAREQRGLNYKEKGKVLVRSNWSPNQNWSLMLIGEPMSNGEAELRAGEQFNEKGLVKGEWRSKSSLNYVGVVAGREREQRFFFGEYFNFTPWDGFSFYADARHPQGYTAWIPRTTSGFVELRDDQLYDPTNFYTISVAGIRWESRNDFRLEFVHNGVGWDKNLFERSLASLSQISPFTASNFSRFYRPGFDLLTENYIYASLRIPDLGKKQNITLYFFNLHSLTDDSGMVQGAVDKPFTDTIVGYGELAANYGKDNTEFKLLSDNFFRFGVRLVF
ncbi:MAG: hypothetical protein V4736_08785 [Bdellovibrionota bacterium]